jgi:phosphate transport system permease protein
MTPELREPSGGKRREPRRRTSLFSHGEPVVWLMGGALGICLAMIVGLLALVLYQGLTTFWPRRVLEVSTLDGKRTMGEVIQTETFVPEESLMASLDDAVAKRARAELAERGATRRRLLRTGNFRLTNTHYDWVSDFELAQENEPQWAVTVERLDWGRFFGVPKAFLIDGEQVESEPAECWAAFERRHAESRQRFRRRHDLETHVVGRVARKIEGARLSLKAVELRHGKDSPQWKEEDLEAQAIKAKAEAELEDIRSEISALKAEDERFQIVMATASGQDQPLVLAEIVRAFPANRLGWSGRLSIYLSRWREFLLDEPMRKAACSRPSSARSP